MRLPSNEELDEVTALIGGPDVRFVDLGPETRSQILQLALQADTAQQLYDLCVEAEAWREIAEWFKNSKVYYP